eukprot:scaffold204807_cov24-Tisochrysis_lutea.AAC.2
MRGGVGILRLKPEGLGVEVQRGLATQLVACTALAPHRQPLGHCEVCAHVLGRDANRLAICRGEILRIGAPLSKRARLLSGCAVAFAQPDVSLRVSRVESNCGSVRGTPHHPPRARARASRAPRRRRDRRAPRRNYLRQQASARVPASARARARSSSPPPRPARAASGNLRARGAPCHQRAQGARRRARQRARAQAGVPREVRPQGCNARPRPQARSQGTPRMRQRPARARPRRLVHWPG